MSLENPNDNARSAGPSEHELREMLEAAEQRRDAELKRKSRTVSIVLWVPAAIVVAWAAVFLLRYEPPETPPAAKPVVLNAALENAADREDMAVFDHFRPESQRVNPPARPAEKSPSPGQIIDKEDIEFATQLLNFSHAADGKPAAKPETKR